MTILLTGGAGYIGTHTCVALLELGYDIIVADNYINSTPLALDRVREITGKDFRAYDVDVCDIPGMERVFTENKIDAVIHFAGLKAVGESCSIPLRYYRNNLDSTLTLLECMQKFNVHHFVFSSSATVYGTSQNMPLDENEPTGCTNPYGWTKYMIEQILRDTAAADPAFSAVLLRYFNPIGAHESGLIGEDPNGIPNNLMPRILNTAAGKMKALTVFGNDYSTADGTGVRDYIHVCDLAEGHAAAIKYAMEHRGAEAINLGTGNGYSVFEMIHTFEQVNNTPVPYTLEPRRPGDIAVCYASPDKAEACLGWKAKRGLAEMCRDAWNWQQKNPNGYKA